MSFFDMVFAFLLAMLIWQFANTPQPWKRDTTDAVTGQRSGLIIYTDQATGVQYVASAFGMAVRVDLTGKPYREAPAP